MDLTELRKIRKYRGLSIKDVAQLTGLSREHIGNIEMGKANPGWQTICKIAQALRIDIKFVI